jgi:hypothetical protein
VAIRFVVCGGDATTDGNKQSADKSSEQQQRQDLMKTCIQRTYRCNPMSRASADDRDRFDDLYRAHDATARCPG